MASISDVKALLNIDTIEFVKEWRLLSEEEKEWFKIEADSVKAQAEAEKQNG